MTLKDFSILSILCLFSISLAAQQKISGTIISAENNKPIPNVDIYDQGSGKLATTNESGYYEFTTEEKQLKIIFFSFEYEVFEKQLVVAEDIVLNVSLKPLGEQLSEVELNVRKTKIFALKRLKDVEETAIFAGKKTEVVLVEQSMANLASNNARQIYSQVVGLNIYQNDDAGLQLNIGGRGLDPNRTANFNTRQNGYDISADVLGYPESYYSPAAEGLQEIQIIRGAASLQYGTQFGGLVNFVMKKPNQAKPFEFITRNTIGSNNLYTNFTSISGTVDKFSYYSFFNYKKGDGFRPNSEFESKNAYAHIGYQFNERTKLEAEVTYLRYLAKQAGGLTDAMFTENPFQSNRARNWFQIDWLLYNVKLSHKFSEDTNFTFNAFGLNASRNALGFRTNRVNQVDPGTERDLIKGDFNNFGFEARLLSNYEVFGKKSTFLIGSKFYKADNTSAQGPGSAGSDPNFEFQLDDYPNYQNQSAYDYPNLNVAIFGENIFYLNDKLSITPGFRFEHIKTESDGFFKRINTDGAGNVILNETVDNSETRERSFVLFGLGASYKPSDALEIYGNVSQNYRSVTFTDISIINPAFAISPEIDDEKGMTIDFGVRGNYKNMISYDLGAFGLFYNDRIGFVQRAFADGSVKSERGNIGDAIMYGFEGLLDFNLNEIFIKNNDYSFNYFINAAITDSEYTKTEESGVEGNNVEFVPNVNLKTGIRFGYKNFLSNIQYSYISQQFTDASNAVESNLSGVIGEIPAYDILDISFSYTYKNFKLETGINNLLDNEYFTRRATGYPGPGIIPSVNRNFYATLQIKL
ncbi:iron(III) dicitrate transport protein, outer membrane receptor [Kordia algicida OT-1]|uniref:Iron(III) dicitrate transport protein, outer membrane receptor n=1 Tax=Kordia algicida OT-1 TaxID=391587 RepID=A9DUG0_9FLAO|nr:TonB-dependent receptor [Kordia algicida]EDP96286.1 iron(III) dicitrate transport protein, outer membrane receptor [Kordia algicida OT-1]